MTRREAREELFKLIYELSFREREEYPSVYACAVQDGRIDENTFIRDSFDGICGHLAEIDAEIGRRLRGWTIARISRVSLAILRVSVYELCYTDIPFTVSVNEAIEIAKKYDHDNGPSFINGVLNAVGKKEK